VKFKPATVAAERVGEYQVGAGVDKRAVQRQYALRMVQIPQLRRIAGLQTHGKQVGAGRAVGEKKRFLCKRL